MFNEYLCRNFVANEIVSQIRKPAVALSKRVGRPFSASIANSNSNAARKSRAEASDVKDNMLADQGSSNYRDWLSKTTTLEDVQRHYDKKNDNSRMSTDVDEEYDGGEITGYAIPGPTGGGMRDFQQQNFPLHEQQMNMDAEKHGGDFDYTPHHVHFHGGDKSSHGMALSEIFDVALTALAFLSFGIFILQVIMCISMNKTMTMTMMPMMNGGSTDNVDDVRFKRDANDHQNLRVINELTRRVLRSLEVALQADKDDEGACLQRTLCENNKYSRNVPTLRRKIQIPIWGLGLSWLSSHLASDASAKTFTMLGSLKACAFGLAGADCESLYEECGDMNKFIV